MESRIQDCLAAFPYMVRPQDDSMYNPGGGRGGGTAHNGLFGEVPLSVSGILLPKGQGNLSFFLCKMHFMAVKNVRKCSGFVIY